MIKPLTRRMPISSRMYWKRKKALAVKANRNQEIRYQESTTPETSLDIELTTELGTVLTTQTGVWITT